MGIVILLTLITIKPSRMLRLFDKSLGNPTHKLINNYILTQYIVFCQVQETIYYVFSKNLLRFFLIFRNSILEI